MRRPTEDEFLQLCRQGNLVPLVREVLADLETPISLFRKLRPLGAVYLLESAEQGMRFGRYSFIGIGPALRLTAEATGVRLEGPDGVETFALSPLDALRQVMSRFRPAVPADLALPRFYGGAVGYFGYDLVNHLERLPRMRADGYPWPTAEFVVTDEVLVVDHLTHRLLAVENVRVGTDPQTAYRAAMDRLDRLVAAIRDPLQATAGGAAPTAAVSAPRSVATTATPPQANMAPEEFCTLVERAKEYIRLGDIFQVVLSQRLERPLAAEPFDVYRALRSLNPSPYMYFFDAGGVSLAGASPEMLVRAEDGVVETRPIAGARPRGATPEEDERLATELRADPKECAEHVMLVDLGRNDVGRVAAPGSVEVPELMVTERYSHVMHLVSSVRGRLAPGRDAYDALGACFPAGTLSGAPKVRAMEIIAELEPTARGPYGGCVGYFGWAGNMDTCIAIRTVAMAGGRAYVQAGAGIVADSVPEREHQECMNKARAALLALDTAEASAADASLAGRT